MCFLTISSLLPELTKADLREFGVNVDAVPDLKDLDDAACIRDISHFIEHARYDYNQDNQTLTLVIPRPTATARLLAPSIRNSGMTVLRRPGQAISSAVLSSTTARQTSSAWLGLESGLNLGAWRLRNNSTWSDNFGLEAIATTLQRDIKALKSQLELGQTYTNSELFDSVQMTGLTLEADTSMLPVSQQGLRPSCAGIANSDAKVTIKQNGYTLYQSNVSPGPFEIRDLSRSPPARIWKSPLKRRMARSIASYRPARRCRSSSVRAGLSIRWRPGVIAAMKGR
jgi:outer membrane usher protein